MFDTASLIQPWRRAAAGIAILLCTAGAWLAAGQPARARAVAQRGAACYTKAQASEHLGASSLALLKHVLPCEIAKLRHGKLATSARISEEATDFLRDDETLSTSEELKTVEAQQNAAGKGYCAGRAYRDASLIQDSSPPPVLTPASLASELTKLYGQDGLLRENGTVFGFGYLKHVLFNDPHRSNPVAYFVIWAHCS